MEWNEINIIELEQDALQEEFENEKFIRGKKMSEKVVKSKLYKKTGETRKACIMNEWNGCRSSEQRYADKLEQMEVMKQNEDKESEIASEYFKRCKESRMKLRVD